MNTIPETAVLRAYRGRPGCMCGCRGTYFDTAGRGLRGVLKDVNARLGEARGVLSVLEHGVAIVSVETAEGKRLVLYCDRRDPVVCDIVEATDMRETS